MFETGKFCMGLDERGRDWGSSPSQQSTLGVHICRGVSMDTEMPTGISGRPDSASLHPSPILMYQRLTQEQAWVKAGDRSSTVMGGTAFQM